MVIKFFNVLTIEPFDHITIFMRSRFSIDWFLVSPALILVFISLTTLFSIDFTLFRAQLISFIVALLGFFFFSRINLAFLRQIKFLIYIGSIIFLAILFVIGIESRGATRWINLFGTSIQFSEVIKPFLAVAFSAFLAETTLSKRRSFLAALLLLLPVFFLIVLQPDLGSGLIFAFVALFVLLVHGYPLYFFGIAAIPVVLSLPFVWTLLHDYQRQRILTLLHPSVDPLGTSYNSIQAIIAIGSGTFFGRGWFEGTQSTLRFLPERHTDFIFATIAEGIGFLGTSFVVLIFAFLCFRVYHVFANAEDQFSRLFAACCFGFFFIQGVVNIGMNIGILPVVGVTLPFVSFGGNSLVANFVFLGILTGISVSQKKERVLEIR